MLYTIASTRSCPKVGHKSLAPSRRLFNHLRAQGLQVLAYAMGPDLATIRWGESWDVHMGHATPTTTPGTTHAL